MKKKMLSLILGLFVFTVMFTVPSSSEARINRGFPEFGQNELNEILGDFMIKSKLNLGKKYTAEKITTSNDLTTYVIEKGGISPMTFELSVQTNASDIITKVYFDYAIGRTEMDVVNNMCQSWANPVRWKYGDPTDEGYSSSGLYYAKYVNDSYKYRCSAWQTRSMLSHVSVSIEAL